MHLRSRDIYFDIAAYGWCYGVVPALFKRIFPCSQVGLDSVRFGVFQRVLEGGFAPAGLQLLIGLHARHYILKYPRQARFNRKPWELAQKPAWKGEQLPGVYVPRETIFKKFTFFAGNPAGNKVKKPKLNIAVIYETS